MIRVAAGPQHVLGITCWCRPRPCHDPDGPGDGWVWVHRNIVLRPDVRWRCFQSVLLGPPV